MNVDILKKSGQIIFETISGSHSYGTNIPTSDIDIKGIFRLPINKLLTLENPIEQVADEKNDIVYYELKRFFNLASGCNPNIIELLYVERKFIQKCDPVMEHIIANRHLFLSKKAYHTFSGYAFAQIKKAKGQNKWINNKQSEEQPDKLDFCWFVDVQDVGETICGNWHEIGKTPCRPTKLDFSLDNMRCAKMEHMENTYRLYRAASKFEKASGVFKNNQIVYDSIPLDEEWQCFAGLLIFNEPAYVAAVRDWKNYWEWVEKRNPHRYVSQENGEVDYDCKNMQHCIRLLFSAENILINHEPIVMFSGEKLQYLKDIRLGKYSYDELLKDSEVRLDNLSKIVEESDLPHSVDIKKINALYTECLNLGSF